MSSQWHAFVPANFGLDIMKPHKHDLVAKYCFIMVASKVKFWASFEIDFFMIAGILKAETSASGKLSVYLL